MSSELQNKTALVTGATAGIGRAVAIALAEAGADVCLNHLNREEETQAVADEIVSLGRKAIVCNTDVSDLAAVEAMVGRTVAELGPLDIAVTNAYYSRREPLCEADIEEFRKTVEVTMWGALYTFRAAAQQMIRQQQGGSLVAIGSPHGYLPIGGTMAYNMAKAGIMQMARTAAVEWMEHRIRVNVVHPGWTDTEGERRYYSEEEIQAAAANLPWGRLAQPDEIGRAVVFFCDPGSDYITGTSLLLDGGLSLRSFRQHKIS